MLITFPRLLRFFILICLTFLINGLATAQADNLFCDILVYNQSESVIFRYDTEDKAYSEIMRLSGSSYWISSTSKYIAVEQQSSVDGSTNILIYDTTVDIPILSTTIQNFQVVRGNPWSSSDEFLLIQDAQGNNLLHIYDLNSGEIDLILESYTTPLSTYQASWGVNDEYVMLVAEENPFPRTEYGDVFALYTRYLDDSYVVVSTPEENVQWYFQSFVSTDEGITYSSCDADDESCQITFVNLDQDTRTVIEGLYYLRGKLSGQRLILTDSGEFTGDGINSFQVLSLDLDSLILARLTEISIDSDYPVPLLSWSANGEYISYVDSEGSTVIYDLSEDTSTVIDVQIESDAGRWNPTGNLLLLTGSDNFYLYDADNESVKNIIEIRNDDALQSPSWVCSN